MYMCMCVYIVCVYNSICTCTYVYKLICMHNYINVHTIVCITVYVHLHVCMYICMYVRI